MIYPARPPLAESPLADQFFGTNPTISMPPSPLEITYASLFASVAGGPANPDQARRYFLKPGYVSRDRAEFFLSNIDGTMHQPDVYELAARLARQVNATCLIDFGCGRGRKLIPCSNGLDTIGIDIGDNIAYCRATHSDRRWLDLNLDAENVLPISTTDLERSVMICADVIEHVVHPEHLLSTLRQARQHAALLVLTTPERDLVRGLDNMGPPPNKHHIREWNLAEFAALLEHHGLRPRRLALTRANDATNAAHTILALI